VKNKNKKICEDEEQQQEFWIRFLWTRKFLERWSKCHLWGFVDSVSKLRKLDGDLIQSWIVDSEAAAAAERIAFHHLQLQQKLYIVSQSVSVCLCRCVAVLQKFFELAIGVTSTVAGIIYLLATWQNVQNPRKNCNLSWNLCKCKKSRMGDGSSVEKVESAPF
jgi:hypothetical protein